MFIWYVVVGKVYSFWLGCYVCKLAVHLQDKPGSSGFHWFRTVYIVLPVLAGFVPVMVVRTKYYTSIIPV